jgi:hypothetical protein
MTAAEEGGSMNRWSTKGCMVFILYKHIRRILKATNMGLTSPAKSSQKWPNIQLKTGIIFEEQTADRR